MLHAASHVAHQAAVIMSHCGDLGQHGYRASISGRTAPRSMKWLTKDDCPARWLVRGGRKNSTVLVMTVVER
jgi:hypothetical protein